MRALHARLGSWAVLVYPSVVFVLGLVTEWVITRDGGNRIDWAAVQVSALLAAAVAAILYAKYAYDLANVTEQTRMDGHRPIVIPANWGKCIQNKYTVRKSVLDERQEDYPYLKVRNVGVGPALNIYLRLNRSRPDQGENKPELLVDPSRSSVRHLAAGDEEYAVQWGADVGQSMVARDIDLQENDILIIAYDDLFKRPFESSYKRVQGKWMWQGDKTPERQWPHAVKDSSGL